nr:hypothetical protein [uncultured Allomuricauda sp.]
MKKKIIVFIIKWIRQVDSYSPYPLFYHWRMSKNEKKMFDRILKKAKGYLEFGSGGSTIRALQKSNAKIYSIESSKDWIEFMRKYLIVRYNEGTRLNFSHVYIGDTKEWGYPVNDSSKHLFPKYSSSIFETLDSENLDAFFIDGRFRVACVLSVILQISSFDISNKTILVHDFWNREHYHAVLNYLEVIDRVDTLGVFKIKENLNISDVEKDYDQYKFDSR